MPVPSSTVSTSPSFRSPEANHSRFSPKLAGALRLSVGSEPSWMRTAALKESTVFSLMPRILSTFVRAAAFSSSVTSLFSPSPELSVSSVLYGTSAVR